MAGPGGYAVRIDAVPRIRRPRFRFIVMKHVLPTSKIANQFQNSGNKASDRTIPSLDGLRAVSIALVILAHARMTKGFPVFLSLAPLSDHGQLGVQIFFVISGFLITRLLLEEQEKTGAISLNLFYARRALRIFPPFYLFLAILAVAVAVGAIHIAWLNLVFAATYTMNYLQNGVWITGHIWSLSVEEQFYLAWPLLLKVAGRKRSLLVAAGVALLSPLCCLAVYIVNPIQGGLICKYFPLVADSIAAGCVLAGVFPWLRRHGAVLNLFAARGGDVVLVLIPLFDLGRSHPRVHYGVTEIALNVAICYAIVRYTQFPNRRVARLLNQPALGFIGRLSYSLYLWQQLFMNRFGDSMVQTFPLNLVCSFACALASWYLVELPMAGMRRRLRPTAQHTACQIEAAA